MSRVIEEMISEYTLDSSGYVTNAREVVRRTEDIGKAADKAKRDVSEFEKALKTFAGATAFINLADAVRDTFSSLFDFLKEGFREAFDLALTRDSNIRALALYSENITDLKGQLERLREIAKSPGIGLEEAQKGSVRLQAAGLSARTAERSLRAFANAIASAGGSKDDLDETIRQLSQIAAAGKLSGDELNVIAERAPQIRGLIKQAFGSTDSKEINKLGLSVEDLVGKIVSAAETLPQATASFQTQLDNFSDSFNQALEPIGRGALLALTSAGPAIERTLALLSMRFMQFAEALAAVGTSGVLGEVIDRVTGFVDSLLGKDPFAGMVQGLSNFLSLIVNLPGTIQDVGRFLFVLAFNTAAVFQNLLQSGQNFVETLLTQFRQWASEVREWANEIRQLLQNPIPTLMNAASGLFGGGVGTDKRIVITPPPTTAYPMLDFPAIRNPFQDADRFAKMISDARKPLPEFPDPLQFGGNKAQEAAKAQDKQIDLLSAIEKNTAQTTFDLQAAFFGGGPRAGLGVNLADIGPQSSSRLTPQRLEVALGDAGGKMMEAMQEAIIETLHSLSRMGMLPQLNINGSGY